MEPLTEDDIKKAFASPALLFFNEIKKLEDFLLQQTWKNKNLLLMSSGNFGGLDITSLAQKI
jgi:UDP-N-acetylmuramate: L-alanyl-gamma-D-glutamyl-meso-diaminopimelate ligase